MSQFPATPNKPAKEAAKRFPKTAVLSLEKIARLREPSSLRFTSHPLLVRTAILLLVTVYLPLHSKITDTVRKIQYSGIISIRYISVMASHNYPFLNFIAHLSSLHTCLLFSCIYHTQPCFHLIIVLRYQQLFFPSSSTIVLLRLSRPYCIFDTFVANYTDR